MEKEEEDEVLKMKELTYFGAPGLKTHFDRVITTILFIIIIILSSLSFHFSLITELSFFFYYSRSSIKQRFLFLRPFLKSI